RAHAADEQLCHVEVIAERDARHGELQVLEGVDLLHLETLLVDDGYGRTDVLQRLLAPLRRDDDLLDLSGRGDRRQKQESRGPRQRAGQRGTSGMHLKSSVREHDDPESASRRIARDGERHAAIAASRHAGCVPEEVIRDRARSRIRSSTRRQSISELVKERSSAACSSSTSDGCFSAAAASLSTTGHITSSWAFSSVRNFAAIRTSVTVIVPAS